MKYVIDSSSLIDMKHFYPNVFVSFWERLDKLVLDGSLISVREVFNEMTGRNDFLSAWVRNNEQIFLNPSGSEFGIIQDILTNHKEIIKQSSFNLGRPVADPFLIAKAAAHNLILVSNETFAPNAHKIPNICKEHNVECINLEEFMNRENWRF